MMRALFLLLTLCAGPTAAQPLDPALYQSGERKSGYLFLSQPTRALQDDDFMNPGLLAMSRGARLWNEPIGSAGQSCAGCHGPVEEAMRGVATRYPVYDEEAGGLVNLEKRINDELTGRTGAEPLPYESEELLALTGIIANASRGMPMEVDVEGPAAEWFEKGREFYFQRRGQLDLACNQCHDQLVGQKLRGDVISQGQINGFPVYRLQWRRLASRHRMFEWCNTSIRAEPYAYGSPEYLALELYVAWRGRGLPIEAPAVRR